jgi:hypothetical protein
LLRPTLPQPLNKVRVQRPSHSKTPEDDEEEHGVQQSWGKDYGLESRELSKRGEPPQRGESRGDSKGESKSDPKSTELSGAPSLTRKCEIVTNSTF